MLLLHGARVAAELALQPLECIDKGLGRRDDIEWGWTGAALLKVTDPQAAPRELPLDIRTFLEGMGHKRMKSDLLRGGTPHI